MPDLDVTFSQAIDRAAGYLEMAADSEELGRMAELRAIGEAWIAIAHELAPDAG